MHQTNHTFVVSCQWSVTQLITTVATMKHQHERNSIKGTRALAIHQESGLDKHTFSNYVL